MQNPLVFGDRTVIFDPRCSVRSHLHVSAQGDDAVALVVTAARPNKTVVHVGPVGARNHFRASQEPI